jgi:DNA helicase HerA-like ATPase
MRMGSPTDLDELSRLFGFVPKQLLGLAPRFSQGEALMAGGFIPVPSIVKVDARLTYEGGIDVEVPQRLA